MLSVLTRLSGGVVGILVRVVLCMVVVGGMVSVSMCGTSASTATRATRVPRLWCWALHSQLAPLGVLAKLMWCVITVGARGTTSAIAGSCTGSLQTLPSQLRSQKTDAWQLLDGWHHSEKGHEDMFVVSSGRLIWSISRIFVGFRCKLQLHWEKFVATPEY